MKNIENADRPISVIVYGVVSISRRPFSLVRKTGADLAQSGDQYLTGAHLGVKSAIANRVASPNRSMATRTNKDGRLLVANA